MNEDFFKEVFYCCINSRSFFEKILPYLEADFFEDENYARIWEEIEIFYENSNAERVTFGILKTQIKDKREIYSILKEIKAIESVDQDALVFTLNNFIKQRKFVNNFNRIAELFRKRDKTEAYDLYKETSEKFAAFSIIPNISSDRVFKDHETRVLDRQMETQSGKEELVPLGLPMIDALMDGGPRKGEATMILGRSGTGKSFSLIHLGVSAARRGLKVIHFQLEGTKRQVLDRYDANWTGSLYKEARRGDYGLNKLKLKRIKKVLERIKGEIYVKAFEKFEKVTIQEIRSFSLEISKKIGPVDLILIDYFELSTLSGWKDNPAFERNRQEELGKAFKRLAVEMNCHVVTPTQANDISPLDYNNSKFVLTSHHLSGHRTKIKPFDNFLTINQTNNEHSQGIARIWVEKIRDNDSKKIFIIGQDLSHSRFFSVKKTNSYLAYLEAKKEENEEEDE